MGYVLLFPKLDLVPVPGTTIALRGEDMLIAILAVRVCSDLVAIPGRLHELRRVSQWLFALLPIGTIGIIVGIGVGILDSPLVAVLFLARRYEYFLLAVAAYLYFRQHKSGQKDAVRLLVFAAYLNSASALGQAAGVIGGFSNGAYGSVSDRVIGLTGGPYELAAVLIVILPLFIWKVIDNDSRAWSLVGVIVIMAALWFTQSRVGLVSAVAILILMPTVIAHRSPRLVAVASLTVASGLLLFTVRPTNPYSGENRFASLNFPQMWRATKAAYERGDYRLIGRYTETANVDDRSFALRIDRWFHYFDGLMTFNPLAGLGPSAGKEAVDGNYVRVLFEFGFGGLAVFAFLLIAIARTARKIPVGPLRAMAVWGGAGLLLQATFIDVFEASKVAETYWFVLGAGLASITASQPAPASDDRDGSVPYRDASRTLAAE